MKTKALLLLLFWMGLGTSVAQAQGLISVRHYSLEDGLSQNSILNFVQDSDGYIWMGTWNGLEKFDGYTFTNYKSYPADKVRLQHNRLLYVAEGSGHTLWCETYNGKVYLFDTQSGEYIDVFSFHPSIPWKLPDRVVALDNGVLWIIGSEGESWRLDSRCYREKNGLTYFPADSVSEAKKTIYNVILGPDGEEWILTNRGCWVYGQSDMLDDNAYRYAVTVDRCLYLATADGRLSRYDARTGLEKLPLSGNPDAIYGLFGLKNGEIAIGTRRGVLLYNPQTSQCRFKTIDEKAKDIEPWDIYQSSAGDLWMFSGHDGQWNVHY